MIYGEMLLFMVNINMVDINYNGFPTKVQTSETTVKKLFSHFFNIHFFILKTIFYKIYTLLVCLGVCMFVSNKRQNGWTDRTQILYEASHWSEERFMNEQNFKITIQFLLNFENPWFCFIKSSNFVGFVLQCIQRENGPLQ